MSEARTGHTTESAASGDCHLVLIVAAVHAAEGGGAELAGLGVHPHHGDTDQTSVLTLAPHNCRHRISEFCVTPLSHSCCRHYTGSRLCAAAGLRLTFAGS